uniref:Uncharacterized protein n=1 Tax=Anguilla anguilla TaxID=7936 RepID=A0A0E9WND4_ANGAN
MTRHKLFLDFSIENLTGIKDLAVNIKKFFA